MSRAYGVHGTDCFEVGSDHVGDRFEIFVAHPVDLPGMPLSGAWSAVVDTLVVNEGEASLVGGAAGLTAESPAGWAAGLQRLGYAQVILTVGPQGAYVATADGARHVPAWGVDTIDTTGAGDGFVGGLAVALAERQALDAAVRFACAVGALATTAMGAQVALPDRAAVGALVED